jgi:hypothetical protein
MIFPLSVQGQGTSVAIQAGPVLARAQFKNYYSTSATRSALVGFRGGATMILPILQQGRLSLETVLLFKNAGCRIEGQARCRSTHSPTDSTCEFLDTWRLAYLVTPIVLRIQPRGIGPGLYGKVGPEVGLLLSAKDLGLLIGIGFERHTSRFPVFAECCYSHGMIDILEPELLSPPLKNRKFHNREISLSVGMRFP